jgi:hypothetical protein
LQQGIRWWCESRCSNRRTTLINPSKWTLMYCNLNLNSS